MMAPPAADGAATEGYAGDYDLSHTQETVSFWQTEKDRLAWAATPRHDIEFPKVISRCRTRLSNRQELLQLWGSPVGAAICDSGVHWAEAGQEAELEDVRCPLQHHDGSAECLTGCLLSVL
eukprot:SAG31_NODE_3330_length_4398_cov_5.734589_9_plen_121_part_00